MARSVITITTLMLLMLGACFVDFDENLLIDGSAPDVARADVTQDLPGDGPVSDQDQSSDTPPEVDAKGDLPDLPPDSKAPPPPDLPTPPDSVLPDQAPPPDLLVPDLPAPDVLSPDAGPVPDLGNCPIGCTSCAGGTCTLSCTNGCTCPVGWNVVITCGTSGCQGAINCSLAKNVNIVCPASACTGAISCGTGTCTVDCNDKSCTNNITCGAGFCSIKCLKGSCTGDIDCSASCGCSIDCDIMGSTCTGTRTCPPPCGNQCGPPHNCNSC